MLSNFKQDIRRNIGDYGKQNKVVALARMLTLNSIHALMLIRLQLWCGRHGIPTIFASKILFWVFKIEIGRNVTIGPGLRLPHPMNIIVAPNTTIGPNCDLYASIRLVWSHGRQQGPTLGEGVFMGDGAKAVGAVQLGDHSIIGVSAVVTKDIPPHCTAVGIPAKIIHQKTATTA